MLRAFKIILRHADDPARSRRPRRCVPSLAESASCLEDRVLLSAAGGKAHAAEMAQNPADTKAGKEVTNLFESILQTNPTGAQLTRLVHELRGGLSVTALRKDLTAQARAQLGAPAQASMNVVVINGDTPALAIDVRRGRPRAGTINPVSIMAGPIGPGRRERLADPASRSCPPGCTSPGRSRLHRRSVNVDVFSSGGTAAASMSTTASRTSTTAGMSSTTGSTSSTPAVSTVLGAPSMLPFTPLTFTPLTFTPLVFTSV